MITLLDLQALLPLIVLSIGAVMLMLQIAFERNPGFSMAIAALTLVMTAISITTANQVEPRQVTPLLLADDYSLMFSMVFVTAAMLTSLLAYDYLSDRGDEPEEFYLLLLLATLGAVVLAYSTHLVSLLLGLELMGVSLYALVAYPDRGALPLEAGIKYLVLSGAASATLLFGFALLYAAVGEMSYVEIGERLRAGAADNSPTLVMAAAAMIFAGLGFKLSVVPFHMWTPDVYEGAPSPVTGFLATVSKAAVFAALLRWFLDSGLYQYPALVSAIALVAIASMLFGNLLALLQSNVKRLLAYSSIAHMGYLLIILVALGLGQNEGLAVEAAAYYLIAYIATTLAAFALLTLISSDSIERDLDQLDDLKGLFWQQPALATLMSIAMMSLAGIPLTAGFIGKYYIFTAGVDGAVWGLLYILVIGSGIGIYYYLRVVYTMSLRAETEAPVEDTSGLSVGRAVAFVLIYVILYLGITPQPVMEFLRLL